MGELADRIENDNSATFENEEALEKLNGYITELKSKVPSSSGDYKMETFLPASHVEVYDDQRRAILNVISAVEDAIPTILDCADGEDKMFDEVFGKFIESVCSLNCASLLGIEGVSSPSDADDIEKVFPNFTLFVRSKVAMLGKRAMLKWLMSTESSREFVEHFFNESVSGDDFVNTRSFDNVAIDELSLIHI